jgi:DUF1680 family protein
VHSNDLRVARQSVDSIGALAVRLEAAVAANRAAVTPEIATVVALMAAISSSAKEALSNAERLAVAAEELEPAAAESFRGFARVIEHGQTAAVLIASLFARISGTRIEV